MHALASLPLSQRKLDKTLVACKPLWVLRRDLEEKRENHERKVS
jgi:hypothetical protein